MGFWGPKVYMIFLEHIGIGSAPTMSGTNIPSFSIDSYQSCICRLLIGGGIPQRIKVSGPLPQLDQSIFSGSFDFGIF